MLDSLCVGKVGLWTAILHYPQRFARLETLSVPELLFYGEPTAPLLISVKSSGSIREAECRHSTVDQPQHHTNHDSTSTGHAQRAPVDCCGGFNNLDYSEVDFTPMEGLLRLVDFCDQSFCVAVITIIFNPLFWNVVARWEHRSRNLSRLMGNPHLACYCLGFIIILLNVYRSHSVTLAMRAQVKWDMMDRTEVFYCGVLLMVFGTLLVVTSFLALGFAGTFLGDYFGILMDKKVTGFPFNIIEHPMYWGSTANYLGLALIGSSPVGLVLTAVIALTYKVAIHFEGPFTEQIYQDRSKCRKHH